MPCGSMHQFFTDTRVRWFFDTSPCLLIVLVSFLFTALPQEWITCKVSVQVPHIAQWFPASATASPSC